MSVVTLIFSAVACIGSSHTWVCRLPISSPRDFDLESLGWGSGNSMFDKHPATGDSEDQPSRNSGLDEVIKLQAH